MTNFMLRLLFYIVLLLLPRIVNGQFVRLDFSQGLEGILKHNDLLFVNNTMFGDSIIYLITVPKYPDLDTINNSIDQKKNKVKKWAGLRRKWNDDIESLRPKRIIHYDNQKILQCIDLSICSVGDYLYQVEEMEIEDIKIILRIKNYLWGTVNDNLNSRKYIYKVIAAEKNMITLVEIK